MKKMMIMNGKQRICPACGNEYDQPPALSRKDNKTEICPLCGVREALLAFSMPEERIDTFLRQLKELSRNE